MFQNVYIVEKLRRTLDEEAFLFYVRFTKFTRIKNQIRGNSFQLNCLDL